MKINSVEAEGKFLLFYANNPVINIDNLFSQSAIFEESQRHSSVERSAERNPFQT